MITATTIHPAGHAEATEGTHAGVEAEHGPTLLGLNAEGWVYTGVSIFLFLAFFVAKAHRMVLSTLDDRIAKAKQDLDEAAKMRADAEALLADAKKREKASQADAKSIVAAAHGEATNLVAKAEADAKQLIARRTTMAEQKIGAAETAAIADVRSRAANAAAAAAAAIIADKHDGKADKNLVDQTIARLN
jgi:F-type H+-transporting ATPase subunit b